MGEGGEEGGGLDVSLAVRVSGVSGVGRSAFQVWVSETERDDRHPDGPINFIGVKCVVQGRQEAESGREGERGEGEGCLLIPSRGKGTT